MAIQQISSVDSGSVAAGKINSNFGEVTQQVDELSQQVDELSQQGGGSDQPSVGILSRNQDAIARVYATKKYVHEVSDGGGQWDRQNNDGLFCIAHGTDFHADDIALKNFLDFVGGVSGINASVITGDFVCVEKNTFSAEAAVIKGVLDAHTVKSMLGVGNHERWSGLSMADITSALGFADNVTSGVIGNVGQGYYYKDFTTSNTNTGVQQQKIRVIMLNQLDHPSSNTKANAAKVGTFSSTQISFFLNALDGAISGGYAVLVAMHCPESGPTIKGDDNPFYQSVDRWNKLIETGSGTIIEDIIAAFRSGGSINKTYTFNNGAASVTVNHNFSGSGHFIAYMIGHTHVDRIGYSPVHPDQLYLMCASSCCMSNEASQQTHSWSGEISDLPRVRGTKTEDCFNVYGIDTIHKTVRVARVGADVNNLMEKREMACFEYQPAMS